MNSRSRRVHDRAWLRVIWACRRDGACYDPAIHQANNKVKPVTETTLSA